MPNWFCRMFHDVRYGKEFYKKWEVGPQCKHYGQIEHSEKWQKVHCVNCCKDFEHKVKYDAGAWDGMA